MLSKLKKKFLILTCENCKKQADFTNDADGYTTSVTWKLLQEPCRVKVDFPKANDKGVITKIEAVATATALFEITLTCPNCGTKKTFQYSIESFKCRKSEKDVPVSTAQDRDNAVHVKEYLEKTIYDIVEIYNDTEKRKDIPYTIHSKNHYDHANRMNKIKVVGEDYKGATVLYHRDIEEFMDAFFLENEIGGKIISAKK